MICISNQLLVTELNVIFEPSISNTTQKYHGIMVIIIRIT